MVVVVIGFVVAAVVVVVVFVIVVTDGDEESALSDCSGSELLCLSAQEHRAVSAAKSIRIYFFIG